MTDEAFVWDARPGGRPLRKNGHDTLATLLARIAELEARVAQLETERMPPWALPVVGLLEDAHARYTEWRPRRGLRARLADFAETLALRALQRR